MKVKKIQSLQYLQIQQFSSLEFCGVKRFMDRPEHSKERFAVFYFYHLPRFTQGIWSWEHKFLNNHSSGKSCIVCKNIFYRQDTSLLFLKCN